MAKHYIDFYPTAENFPKKKRKSLSRGMTANSLPQKPETPLSKEKPEFALPQKPVFFRPDQILKEKPGLALSPKLDSGGTTDTGKRARDGLWGPWGQRIGGGKGIPLDLGVTLAGMLAHSIAPDEWGGRMGKDLANLGGTIYGRRLEHDITAPEREQKSRLTEAQITQAERPPLMKGAGGTMVPEAKGEKFFTSSEIPRDQFESFGYGKMRNKLTGEIVNVPTKPETSKDKELTKKQEIEYNKERETWVEDKVLDEESDTPTARKRLREKYDELMRGIKKPSSSRFDELLKKVTPSGGTYKGKIQR
jgi:hypothetical protein